MLGCNTLNYLRWSWQDLTQSPHVSDGASLARWKGKEAWERQSVVGPWAWPQDQGVTRAVPCPSWLLPHSFHGVLCTILSGNKLSVSVSENQKMASMFVLKILLTSAENIIYKLCIYLFALFMHMGHSPWLSPSALMGKRGKCAATLRVRVLGDPNWGLSIIMKVCRQ